MNIFRKTKKAAKDWLPPGMVRGYAWIRKRVLPPALDRRQLLPKRSLSELFPGIESLVLTVSAAELYRERGTLPLEERLSLAAICRFLQPHTIFEIGTFEGATTVTLVEHSPPEARVYTLDLAPRAEAPTRIAVEIGNITGLKFELGKYFRQTPHRERIVQLFGDSARFDFGPFRSTIDLAFIDGNHAFDNVLIDSANAFQMVRPGGVIVWDDYDSQYGPGVVRALNRLAGEHAIYHLRGTRLAILVMRDATGCGSST